MNLRLNFLVGILFALAAGPVGAIPTNFGGFVGAQGNDRHLPIEEWFRDPGHWLAGSDLPGSWSTAGTDATRQVLENPGAIFGVTARSVAVARDAAGAITEVLASYDEASSKKTRSALVAALQKNIAVFTGSPVVKNPDGTRSFSAGGLKITFAAEGPIIVRIVRS